MVALGTLMVGHWYALPTPAAAQRPAVAAALSTLRSSDDRARWFSVHVLYAECRCSQRIFEHLYTSTRPADLSEHILLIGAHEEYARRAREGGFGLTQVEPEELARRFHLEAAPLLAITDSTEQLRYLGGYTERKQGLDIQDLAILERLRSQQSPDELPLFGCAVARALQTLLDPLGVKYRQD